MVVESGNLGFRLNDNLLSALATHKSEQQLEPNEAFKLLADVDRPSVV